MESGFLLLLLLEDSSLSGCDCLKKQFPSFLLCVYTLLKQTFGSLGSLQSKTICSIQSFCCMNESASVLTRGKRVLILTPASSHDDSSPTPPPPEPQYWHLEGKGMVHKSMECSWGGGGDCCRRGNNS